MEECNETIDEIIHTKNIYKCNSCMVYIVLLSIYFIINVGIGTCFAYYKHMNRNKRNVSKYYDYVYHV